MPPLVARLGLLVCAAACGGGCRNSGAREDGGPGSAGGDASVDAPSGPVITDLVVTPNPKNVLSATVTFTTDRPALDSVHVLNLGDGGAANTFDTPSSSAPTTTHTLAVVGLRASSSFTITARATDPGTGASSSASAGFATGPLPSFLPPFQTVRNDRTRTSPGFTLLTVWKWTGANFASVDPTGSAIVVLDSDFQVVWYYQGTAAGPPWAVQKLPGGRFQFLTWVTGYSVVDLMGNVLSDTRASALGLDSLHHELSAEPGGGTLTMATELRPVSGYPGGDGGQTFPIVGDRIIELGLDGGVSGSWSTFDMVPPFNLYDEGNPVSFLAPFWDTAYPAAVAAYGHTRDWTHGNAAMLDPSDDTIIASSRTQNWIFKFARRGGGVDGGGPRVLWRLGPGGDFTLAEADAGAGFQYGQHGPTLTQGGTILCLDDGFGRPLAPGQQPFSRAVEFALDTSSMTARVVWEYAEPSPGFYSPELGSAYLLDNGNVLIDDGGEVSNRNTIFSDPATLKSARVMEVTHTTPAIPVAEFDVNVPFGGLPSDPSFSGYSVYRAVRIPSLY